MKIEIEFGSFGSVVVRWNEEIRRPEHSCQSIQCRGRVETVLTERMQAFEDVDKACELVKVLAARGDQ